MTKAANPEMKHEAQNNLAVIHPALGTAHAIRDASFHPYYEAAVWTESPIEVVYIKTPWCHIWWVIFLCVTLGYVIEALNIACSREVQVRSKNRKMWNHPLFNFTLSNICWSIDASLTENNREQCEDDTERALVTATVKRTEKRVDRNKHLAQNEVSYFWFLCNSDTKRKMFWIGRVTWMYIYIISESGLPTHQCLPEFVYVDCMCIGTFKSWFWVLFPRLTHLGLVGNMKRAAQVAPGVRITLLIRNLMVAVMAVGLGLTVQET